MSRRGPLIGMVAALGLMAAPIIGRPTVEVTYNATRSAPLGFYRVEPAGFIRPGDRVLSRLPPPVAAFAARRDYLPATVPVLKTVAAIHGSSVCRRGRVLRIDGRVVGQARRRDGAGRPLPSWSGCRRLGEGEVLLLAGPADSFDGRYFGPTSSALILGRVRPVWTW
jgi:conjugative transfer signal peptidase TraF